MFTSVNLHSSLENNKLNGPNFLDQYQNLRIVLKSEKLGYVLKSKIPLEPDANAPQSEKDSYLKHKVDSKLASCIMLISMSTELQNQHEHMDTHTMMFYLLELFGEQAKTERYEISKQLF